MTREQEFNLIGLGLALAMHAGLGTWLYLFPPRPQPRRTVVEVEIRKPPPQAVVTPPEKPPEPERKISHKEQPAQAPKSSAPKETRKPPVPVFGLQPGDTVGQGISVPLGNTTLANPDKRDREVAPLPPSTGVPAGAEYHPVSELDLRALPEQPDKDECIEGLQRKYTGSEAAAQGIEGESVLRIEVDDKGKIHSIRNIKKIGYGLDETVIGWMRFNPRCRFTPATAKDGKPASYIIERYVIHFELNR